MLLALWAACDGGTSSPPPPPVALVGAISGQVSVESQGIDGVTVALSNGASTSTAGGGRFSFANLGAGSYTVTISNFPADVSFSSTSQPTAITTNGQTATVNFSGTYIRTSGISGLVTVDGEGLGGVAVRISGVADQATRTDAAGQYAFTQLRAGQYQVEVSGYAADVGFASTSMSVTVGVDEIATASFSGTYLRAGGIIGRVAVEGAGLGGVTVTLSGADTRTDTTDADGEYAFVELRAGAYMVSISGYDAEEHGFAETSRSVTVRLGQTVNVPFNGTRLRTPSPFSIEIRHVEGSLVTDAHRAVFERAAEIWESAIQSDLPDTNLSQEDLNQWCGSRFEIGADNDLVVDDLLIYAKIYEIDGPGITLAFAGPCVVRGGSSLPSVGIMGFDLADANDLDANGTFERTVLHEMAHVLGFGTIWARKELIADSSTTGNEDPHFTGEAAVAAFDLVGGTSYDDGAKVPVENLGDQGTRNGHWREFVFRHELMTGWISSPDDPLSVVTLASLEDLGYEVKYDGVAEKYALPNAAPTSLRSGRRVDLGNDILRIPIGVVDQNGRVVRYWVP